MSFSSNKKGSTDTDNENGPGERGTEWKQPGREGHLHAIFHRCCLNPVFKSLCSFVGSWLSLHPKCFPFRLWHSWIVINTFLTAIGPTLSNTQGWLVFPGHKELFKISNSQETQKPSWSYPSCPTTYASFSSSSYSFLLPVPRYKPCMALRDNLLSFEAVSNKTSAFHLSSIFLLFSVIQRIYNRI